MKNAYFVRAGWVVCGWFAGGSRGIGGCGVGGWCGGWWLVAAAGLVRLWWVRAGLGWDFLRALRGQNSLAGKNVSGKSCTLYPIPVLSQSWL